MIIHRVWAENVLKYATLELNDLPTRGVIGISGANESGKSSIGEIICLVLFGRTFAYAAQDIGHVIRWEEPSCAASVTFSVNGQRYVVSRSLDVRGHHGARLSDAHDEVLARGVEPVRTALGALLGYGFEEFIESFYLAQRDITTPHPQSTAVKSMAGIAALEAVAAEAKAEMAQNQTAISQAEGDILAVQQRIVELNVDQSLLPRLESARQDLQALQARDTAQVDALQDRLAGARTWGENVTAAVQTFCGTAAVTPAHAWTARVEGLATRLETLAQQQDEAALRGMLEDLQGAARDARQRLAAIDTLRHAVRSCRQHLDSLLGQTSSTSGSLSATRSHWQTQLETIIGSRARRRHRLIVFLVLVLLVWAAWGLITFMPASGLAQSLSSWLAKTGDGRWLLLAAGFLSVVGVSWGARHVSLASRASQLQQSLDDIDQRMLEVDLQIKALDAFDDTPLPQAVNALLGIEDEALSAALLQCWQGPGADWLDAARLSAYQAHLHDLQGRFAVTLEHYCETLAAQVSTLQDCMTQRQADLAPLDAHIVAERERRQQLETLTTSMSTCQELMAASQQRIRVRELACDLLRDGAYHMATTFNRDIRNLVGHTLPLLTQGRYAHLKIDAQLDVQVFSNEKRDFMQLEEISTGTQRQIMLALRLALSQEFINTTLGRPQFLFLDEPFAFFDAARTRSAMQSLPELSRELSQIWIVAQSFPEGCEFDLSILCRQDTQVLTLSGGKPVVMATPPRT
jgi:exonuclease SbcC